MALRKVKKDEPKEVKKPAVKIAPKKIVKKEKEITVTIKPEKPVIVPPVVEVVPQVVEKTKKEHDGIGLIGTNETINTFRGLCKIRGKVLGAELMTMIKAWNEANKM